MMNGDMISRQNVLRCLTDISYNQCKTQGEADAIDIAKTMVITMPSAQPVAKDTNVPNNDCISRQAMFDTAAEYEKQLREILGDENELVEVVKILKHRLIALPSAHPDLSSYSDKLWRNAYERGKAEAQAEIIRCRDCKFLEYDSIFDGHFCRNRRVKLDHFCGYAERRTDDER